MKRGCIPQADMQPFLMPYLNQDSVAVIDLMLNDLRCPAGEGLDSRLELGILVFHLDGTVAFGLALSGQGQTSLFCLIGIGIFDDLRIKHHHI